MSKLHYYKHKAHKLHISYIWILAPLVLVFLTALCFGYSEIAKCSFSALVLLTIAYIARTLYLNYRIDKMSKTVCPNCGSKKIYIAISKRKCSCHVCNHIWKY